MVGGAAARAGIVTRGTVVCRGALSVAGGGQHWWSLASWV